MFDSRSPRFTIPVLAENPAPLLALLPLEEAVPVVSRYLLPALAFRQHCIASQFSCKKLLAEHFVCSEQTMQS